MLRVSLPISTSYIVFNTVMLMSSKTLEFNVMIVNLILNLDTFLYKIDTKLTRYET